MKGTSPGTEDEARKKRPERGESRDTEMRYNFWPYGREIRRKNYNAGHKSLMLEEAYDCPCQSSLVGDSMCFLPSIYSHMQVLKPYFPPGTTPLALSQRSGG